MSVTSIFDLPSERERERLRKERDTLEDRREREYRRRGLEPARDRAGRAFPEGRLEPGDEGLIDLDRRREVDREVLAEPLTEEGEREVWREQNREQFEELEAEERRISGQIKEFEDLGKEVLEQHGIPFEEDPEQGLIPRPPVTEERIKELREKTGDKVGFIRGMLSPRLERGDSTPGARQAERRLEEAEPRLKEWRLAREKLQRIDDLRKRAHEKLKEAETKRHNFELQFRGVTEPEAEESESRFDQPGRREPEPTARMLRSDEKPPERPADHHRYAEGFGRDSVFVHDIPEERAPERIAQYDEQREREAERFRRPVTDDPSEDPEGAESETPELRQESARAAESDDPEEIVQSLERQREIESQRRARVASGDEDASEVQFRSAEDPSRPPEGEEQSAFVEYDGEQVAFIDEGGTVRLNARVDPRVSLQALVDSGAVSEEDASRVLKEGGYAESNPDKDALVDRWEAKGPEVQQRIRNEQDLARSKREPGAFRQPITEGSVQRQRRTERDTKRATPGVTKWHPQYVDAFNRQREEILRELREERGDLPQEGFIEKFRQAGWDMSFGSAMDLIAKGAIKFEDLEVEWEDGKEMSPEEIRRKAEAAAYYSLVNEIWGASPADREEAEGFAEHAGEITGSLAGITVNPGFRAGMTGFRAARMGAGARGVASGFDDVATAAGRGVKSGAEAGAVFTLTNPPKSFLPEDGEFASEWAEQAASDIAGFAGIGGGIGGLTRALRPAFYRRIEMSQEQFAEQFPKIGEKVTAMRDLMAKGGPRGTKSRVERTKDGGIKVIREEPGREITTTLTAEEARIWDRTLEEVVNRVRRGDSRFFDASAEVLRPREWTTQVPFIRDLVRAQARLKTQNRPELEAGKETLPGRSGEAAAPRPEVPGRRPVSEQPPARPETRPAAREPAPEAQPEPTPARKPEAEKPPESPAETPVPEAIEGVSEDVATNVARNIAAGRPENITGAVQRGDLTIDQAVRMIDRARELGRIPEETASEYSRIVRQEPSAPAETQAPEAETPRPAQPESTPVETAPAETAPKPIPEAVNELAESTPRLREMVAEGASLREILVEAGGRNARLPVLDSEGNATELKGKPLAEAIRENLSAEARPEPPEVKFTGYQEGARGEQVPLYSVPQWSESENRWMENTVTRDQVEAEGYEVPETPAPPKPENPAAPTESARGSLEQFEDRLKNTGVADHPSGTWKILQDDDGSFYVERTAFGERERLSDGHETMESAQSEAVRMVDEGTNALSEGFEVGTEMSIMDTPSRLEESTTDANNQRYELFRDVDGKGGALRVVDQDSGEAHTIMRYEDFQAAKKRFDEEAGEPEPTTERTVTDADEKPSPTQVPALPETKNRPQVREEDAPGQETAEAGAETEVKQASAADDLAEILGSADRRVDNKTLAEVMRRHRGGTQAEGAYTVKDAYDTLEIAVNKYVRDFLNIRPDVSAAEAKQAIETIRSRVLDKIPTQTRRTGEMDKMQQFSTPPHLGYAASWVANLRPDDIVLEPSAGLGGIAIFPQKVTESVYMNEFSERRAELLRESGLIEPGRVFVENAEQLDAVFAPKVRSGEIQRPTVVVMNPPFSSSAKMDRKNNRIGAQHVEEALKFAAPGSRVVAILGRGMAMDRPAMKNWWNRISKSYAVRANVGVSGSEYKKYGTHFDNQLIVIDKVPPESVGNPKPVTEKVDSVEKLIDILEEVRNERPISPIRPAESGGQETPSAGRRGSSEVDAGDRAGDVRSPGGRPGESVAGRRSGTAQSGEVRSESGERKPGTQSRSADVEAKGSQGRPEGNRPGGRGDASVESVKVETALKRAQQEMLSDEIFSAYRPSKLKVAGAKPHPTKLVESAAMASVEAPDAMYSPKIPKELIESGGLSEAQLEQIVYAGQAHGKKLPDGQRRGYFIGDGTGVGKGREGAGIILDNWNQGRPKKAVWLSASADLVTDARRDLSDLGIDPKMAISIQKAAKAGEDIKISEGIIFSTYSSLSKGHDGLDDNGAPQRSEKKGRFEQLYDWLGKDFDGVIIFDEAHKAGNAIDMKGKRGIKKASKAGLSVVDLQKALPNARILYMSATGATEVSNLAYAERLGIWGPQTPFPDKQRFINQIQAGGVSAMEIVSRDLKSLGAYLARTLSYEDVSYDMVDHKITSEQREIYKTLAESWQLVFQNVDQAMAESGASNNGRAKSAARSAFFGAQQRFFNQIMTAMSMPSVVKDMEAQLAAGNSPVLQFVNTNEAIQERQLARAKQEEQGDLEDLDMSPRDILLEYVNNSFPVWKYEEVMDSDGNTRWTIVRDSDGNAVEDPAAVERKNQLLDSLATLRLPDNPLDIILNHFGADSVAEVTGRGRRVIQKRQDDGTTKKVIESRSRAKVNSEVQDFKDGDRRVLIFSGAGGTGFSYHASRQIKNQQKRIHYLVQAGWRADEALQGFGRTHRSDQSSAPLYKLVTTDLSGHKRFISTIARRLEQLGALTSGERKSTGQGMFRAEDNLESEYADTAMINLFFDIFAGNVEGWNIQNFSQKLGFGGSTVDSQTGETTFISNLVDDDGSLNKSKIPPIPQFLNRILMLDYQEQNFLFEEFFKRFQRNVQRAKEDGTYDPGTQTLRAQEVNKVSDQVVHEHPDSTAKTRIVEVEVVNPVSFTQFHEIGAIGTTPVEKYVRNLSSKRIYALKAAPDKTTAEGSVVSQLRRVGTRTVDLAEARTIRTSGERANYEEVSEADAEAAWEREIEEAEKTSRKTEHFIVGAFLPIWDRIGISDPKIFRFQTSQGEQLLGAKIHPKLLPDVTSRLGAKAGDITAESLYHGVLDDGMSFDLANDWKVVRRRVSGESRIEILNVPVSFHRQFQDHIGGFIERISFKPRTFIPTEKAAAIPALEKVLRQAPVIKSGGDEVFGAAMPGGAPGEQAGAESTKTRPGPKPKRVEVSPLEGKARPINEIFLDFKKAADIRVIRAKTPRGLTGAYWPGSARTVVRFEGDFSIAAHEIGHSLDDRYAILSEWAESETSPFDDELRKFWIHGSVRSRGPRSKPSYKRREGVAEWIRAYVINPDEAIAGAPRFYEFFQEKVPEKVREQIDQFGESIRRWAGADPMARTISNVDVSLDPPHLLDRVKERLSNIAEDAPTELIDSLHPVWKMVGAVADLRGMTHILPSKHPLVRMINMSGFNRKAMSIMNHGMIHADNTRVPGFDKGYMSLFRHFDHSSKEAFGRDLADTVGLMVNERIIERADQIDRKAADAVRKTEISRLEGLQRSGELSTDELMQKKAQLEDALYIRDMIERELLDMDVWKDRIQSIQNAANQRKGRLAGTGAGIYADHVQAGEALEALQADPERYGRLKEAAALYRTWAQSLLQYAKDKGRISEKQYNQIIESNQFYVSFNRMMDRIEPDLRQYAARSLGSSAQIVYRFKGSTRRIRNPYISLAVQTYVTVREADRNEAMRTLRDLLTSGRNMHEGPQINLAQFAARAQQGDPNTIRIWVDGKAEYWQFQDEAVYRALKGWDDVTKEGPFARFLQISPRILHEAIVHTPGFVLRSTIKDMFHKAVVSKVGTGPFAAFHWLGPGGIREYRKLLQEFNLYGGGLFGHHQLNEKQWYKEMHRMMKKEIARSPVRHVFTSPKALWRAWHETAAGAEIAGRVTEYRNAKKYATEKLGLNEFEAGHLAAFLARDITDYARAGRLIRNLNRYFIFTSAAIRGNMRDFEGVRGKEVLFNKAGIPPVVPPPPGGLPTGGIMPEAPKGGFSRKVMQKNWPAIRFFAKMFYYLGAVSAAAYLWNRMMGAEEEYDQQPSYYRDFFWMFYLGNGVWLDIPKPWQLGTWISGVERAFNFARTGDPKEWEGYPNSLRNIMMPIDETAVGGPLQPFAEVVMNRDMFRKRDIVPYWERDLDLDLREGTERASRLGQAVQGMIGMDARQVDHLIRGQFADMGSAAMDISDIGRDDRPNLTTRGVRRITGAGRTSPAWNARDVQWVLDHSKRRDKRSDRRVDELIRLLEAYNDAEDSEAKAEAARRAREYASQVRPEFEREERRESEAVSAPAGESFFNPFDE